MKQLGVLESVKREESEGSGKLDTRRGPGQAGPGSRFQSINRGNEVVTSVSCENQPGNWSEDGVDRERLETGEPWTKEESKVA